MLVIIVNIFFSVCCERPEGPQEADFQALRGGELDRSASGGQEEEVRHKEQKRKLVTQVQRDLPLVSR